MYAAILMSALVLAATQGQPAGSAGTAGGTATPSAAAAGNGVGGRPSADRRLVNLALDAAERATDAARQAVRAGQWAVARAHVDHLHDWLGLAARIERPVGEAAVRWDFAAREARRLDVALMKRDATTARWADAALTLALVDARASLGDGGGGGGAQEPDGHASRRVTDPAKKYENVPLERDRPWSRGRQ